jgi:hypothetical protein
LSKSRGRFYFDYTVGVGTGASVPGIADSAGAPGIGAGSPIGAAGGASTPGSVVPVPIGSGAAGGGVGVHGAVGAGAPPGTGGTAAVGSVTGGVATPVPSLFGPILKITAFLFFL